ncbi:MAG: mechanosensitive ion channel family protein [Candidatus Latescibacterota bacterium]|nr:MAG: mechanosensitive ion channel family protein [Candidatus Latescibacterota bacterium]
MDDVHELADVLIGLEEKGPQEQLRAEVEELYGYATPGIWNYINRLRGEIDETRGRRLSTTGADRLALEDRVAMLTSRVDHGYEIGQAHIEKRKALGLDTTAVTITFKDLLTGRARELSGRVGLALERIDDLTARVSDVPDDAELRVNLVAAHKSLDINTASMAVVLDIMDAFEMSTEDYRAQLVTATRDLTTGLLDKDVAAGLISRAVGGAKDWLVENGPGLLVKFLLIFIILFIFRILARLVRKGLGRALDASSLNVSTLLRRMILTSAANAVLILGLLIALSQLGITLGPLLAGLGVAGFIVGFALQDTLANFAAGMMILIYRPYDVGDLVDAAGVFGKVNKMSLVSTTILTIDNQTIIVPNNKIWGDVIKNVTAQDLRRVDMVFGIGYADDIPKAEKVLEDILRQHDKVLDDPPYTVKLHTLGESSVDFIVRPWVAVDDYWDVYWDVTRTVKMRFDEEDISIPFPQRDVHIYEEQVSGARESVADTKGQTEEVDISDE